MTRPLQLPDKNTDSGKQFFFLRECAFISLAEYKNVIWNLTVTSLAWTGDGYALAVGFKLAGCALYGAAGNLIFHEKPGLIEIGEAPKSDQIAMTGAVTGLVSRQAFK